LAGLTRFDQIGRSLDCAREVLRHAGCALEPDAVPHTVEKHRFAWRPAQVKLLLIGESHVYTSAEDFALRVRREALPNVARHAPPEFVRLIYCLGYGQGSVLSGRASRNGGTWQFWNIFGRLARTGRLPTTRTASAGFRIDWKVRTLVELQRRGVWLIDASLHGIYSPGGMRVGAGIGQALHACWWQHYGRWLVEQCPQAYRCAIGRRVFTVLGDLGVPLDEWIYQPQARHVAGLDREHGWAALLDASADSATVAET
jgi:hypothetical protein